MGTACPYFACHSRHRPSKRGRVCFLPHPGAVCFLVHSATEGTDQCQTLRCRGILGTSRKTSSTFSATTILLARLSKSSWLLLIRLRELGASKSPTTAS